MNKTSETDKIEETDNPSGEGIVNNGKNNSSKNNNKTEKKEAMEKEINVENPDQTEMKNSGEGQEIEKNGAESSQKEQDGCCEELTPEELLKEVAKYKALALRSRADYDNLKKRIERQKIEIKNFLIREMASGILASMDDFDRALEATGNPQTIEEKGEKFDGIIQGVEMVIERINGILKGFGVEEIGEKGDDFDPNFHEAIHVEEDPDITGQKIGNVFQKGYKIEDFVIRNAKVQVLQGKQGVAENENSNLDRKLS